ncbi:MAG: oligosaccharide flippase family protein [Muribaculaceae bacterium]|nr:oligosaccharide flippase family protein [Muribaculaceae bacterium]
MSASQKVLKALGVFGSVQSVGILCSIVRAKLIAIAIGSVGVGLFGIFNAVIELMATATQLNMRQSAVRDIADASEAGRRRMASAVRWWARVLGMFGAVAIIALSPVLSFISFKTLDWWWAFASLSVVLFCSSITGGEQTILQGTGQLKRLAHAVMWGSVVGTALSAPMYFLLGEGSIIPSLIVFGLSSMAASLISCRYAGVRMPWRQKMAEGKGFLRLGAYLTVSSLVALGASYIFKSFLALRDGLDAVGLYQAGYTLMVNYVGIVFTAIGMEFYPRLSSVAMRTRIATRVVSHEVALLMCVLAPLVVAFTMADELMVRILYTDAFLPIVPMILFGIGGAVFRAIAYCHSFVVVARADGKCFVVVEIASAVIGLALNILFYDYWGIPGLGLSYALWYAIYAGAVVGVCHWRYGLHLSRKSAFTALAAIAIAASAILLRHIGWWAPALMLPACALTALLARRRRA